MFKLLAQFGFAKENTALDVPAILHSILSKETAVGSPNIRPSTYMLDPRNNNPVPGGLLPSPVTPFDLMQRQDHHVYPPSHFFPLLRNDHQCERNPLMKYNFEI